MLSPSPPRSTPPNLVLPFRNTSTGSSSSTVDIVNTGVWAEMLVDCKFFDPLSTLAKARWKFPLRFTAAADSDNATLERGSK